ncbi:MAG: phosphotransferase [Kiritimatiellaeota bacterium]|nr:phosphotransferase [Kiritimatiellota bacterium]
MTDNEAQKTLPKRPELSDPGRRTLIRRGHSVIHPDVYVFETANGTRFLVKDMHSRPLMMRWLVGRRCLRHEYRILKGLRNGKNIPQVYGMPDRDALILDFIEAAPLPPEDEPGERGLPGPEFFTRLKDVLTKLHERGVAHGDIRRKNVLWDADDQPYLIDFGTAVCRDGAFGWFRRQLFRAVRRVDDVTLLKLQHSYHPESLTEAESIRLKAVPWYLQVGRFLRKHVYRPFIKQKRWHERLERFKRRRHQE